MSVFFVGCNNNHEEEIKKALEHQLSVYPESRLQDIYKNFYQDCFGTGHAISDTSFVIKYLEEELLYEDTICTPLVEPLGWRNNFVRVSNDMVKQGKLTSAQLAHAFIESASLVKEEEMQQWTQEWHTIVSLIAKNNMQIIDFENDMKIIDSLLTLDPRVAMHHSRTFNQHYRPHYRVVEKAVYDKMMQK
jgi:hypothetical protein